MDGVSQPDFGVASHQYNFDAAGGDGANVLPMRAPISQRSVPHGEDPVRGGFSYESEMSNSPATSPPSSIAPASEDEFTTFLLRRAARQLGVDYAPASSSGYRAAVSQKVQSPGHHDGLHNSSSPSVLTNYSTAIANAGGGSTAKVQQQPQSAGFEPLATVGASAAEIQRMIGLRTKALGDSHPSIALLLIALGDRLVLDGEGARAEASYTAALEKQEGRFGATASQLLPTLAKMGAFFAQSEKFVQSKLAFQRAAAISDLHAGGFGDADNGESREAQDRSKQLRDTDKLRATLAELQSKHVPREHARSAVAEGLLSTLNAAASNSTPQKPHQRPAEAVSCEVQTDEAFSAAFVREMAAKHGVDVVAPNDPLPPKPTALTAEQRERIRQPTRRTAEDLKKLVDYIRSNDSMTIADRARQTASSSMSFSQGTHTDSTSMLSPRSLAARQAAQRLHETLGRSRSESSVLDRSSYDRTSATEQAVARMLLDMSNSS